MYNIQGVDYSFKISKIAVVKVIIKTPRGEEEKIIMRLATSNYTNEEVTQQAIEDCLRYWEENRIEFLRGWGFPENSKTDIVILTVP